MSDKPDFKAMARDWYVGESLISLVDFAVSAYEAGVAAERERCARVIAGMLLAPDEPDAWDSGWNHAVNAITAAIRSGK
jgi:hypothetical protein